MKTIKTFLKLVLLSIILNSNLALNAQERIKPTWWFGVSGAGNFNFYRGTAQILNDNLTSQYAFTDGFGVAPYFSIFAEYRPDPVWGLMLNVAYDGHRGTFNRSDAPSGVSTSLNAEFDYASFEPSLRIAPFAGNFYLFIGPRLSYNVGQSFSFQVASEPDQEAEWNDVYGIRLSGQVGAGYEIPLSAPDKVTQVNLSPFIAFIPYFGDQPRSIENLTLTTVRAGIAIKFGVGPKPAPPVEVVAPPAPIKKEVGFSVHPPEFVPGQRIVLETLPLSNHIFFETGNTEIPDRYVLLTKDQATGFTEEQLQNCQKIPDTRPVRQLKLYHNILNIVAYRMKKFPESTITLVGSSAKRGKKKGEENANAVKNYFVNIFGIDGSRIKVEGRGLPIIPSEEYPNSTTDTALTRVEDNRVDIISSSPDLMMESADNTALCLKPIEVTAMDGSSPDDAKVILNATGANDVLISWSVDVTDEAGNVQHFGPFINDQASISGSQILKDAKSGTYKIVLTGQTKLGDTIRKESSFSLQREIEPVQHEQLTSILFEFDKSKTVATYENFLTNTVAPMIPSNATVIISGHTDIVGSDDYNMNLSIARAKETQNILDSAVIKAGKTGVTYQAMGYGIINPPFANNLPEERFYNRTVNIDIIPAKKSNH